MIRNLVSAVAALVVGALTGIPQAVASAPAPARAAGPAIEVLEEAGVPADVLTDLTTAERAAVAGSLAPAADADQVSLVTLVDGAPEFRVLDVEPSRAGDVVDVLRAQPSVEAAGVAQPVRALADPRRPKQWPLDTLRAEAARALLPSGVRPVVAVLDTGVLGTHPDLQAALRPGTDLVGTGDGRVDPHGHGTHVAGTIGATVGNGVGVEGFLPEVTILPVRVLDATGKGDTGRTARGITWAADNGADVINLSLGSRVHDPVLEYAVDYAAGQGVSVVAAAGNEGNTIPYYPARYDSLIAVGATTKTDELAYFSSMGPHLDLSAPGLGVLSTTTGTKPYGQNSGTSMAAPHVAAVVAGLRAQHPTLGPAQLQAHLQSTATDLGAPGFDHSFGHGRVDPYAAYSTPPAGSEVTVPGAPRVLGTSPGDRSVTVTWSAPAVAGSSPVTGYTVSLVSTGRPAVTTEVPAGDTTATVGGLVNGATYDVAVTARNSQGGGPSEGGHTVCPRTVPAAPVVLRSEAGDATATIEWDRPVDTGGADVTGYRLEATTGGSTRTARVDDAGRYTFPGLTNGMSYDLTVRAENEAGLSAAGTAGPLTPTATPRVPAAPSLDGLTPGDAALQVQWSASVDPGAAPVTAYVVTATPPGAATGTTTTATAAARSATVGGLDNGVPYSVVVRAVSEVGTSAASDPSTGVPRTVPGAPTVTGVEPGDAVATLRWDAPASDGGADVTDHVVTVLRAGHASRTLVVPATARELRVEGLQNGVGYSLHVQARNVAGPGAMSATVVVVPVGAPTVGAPTAPGVPTVRAGSTRDAAVSVSTSWTPPAAPGGGAVSGYTVSVRRAGSPDVVRTVSGTTRRLDVAGLTRGAAYTVVVRAHNAAGAGPYSEASAAAVAR